MSIRKVFLLQARVWTGTRHSCPQQRPTSRPPGSQQGPAGRSKTSAQALAEPQDKSDEFDGAFFVSPLILSRFVGRINPHQCGLTGQ
jgi:hypothetical protein